MHILITKKLFRKKNPTRKLTKKTLKNVIQIPLYKTVLINKRKEVTQVLHFLESILRSARKIMVSHDHTQRICPYQIY